MGDWIKDNIVVTLVLMIFIFVGTDILVWEIYQVKRVNKKDNITYDRSKNYTDSVYTMQQDSIIFYVKGIHKILDDGTRTRNIKSGND